MQGSRAPGNRSDQAGSAQAHLAEDALAGEEFGGQADHKAQHGQTAIPGFSKSNETEAGGVVSHGAGDERLSKL